jgi:hypothetical protein
MLAKIRAGLKWFVGGVMSVASVLLLWKLRGRRPPLRVIPGAKRGDFLPKPIPAKQSDVDAELRKLGRMDDK